MEETNKIDFNTACEILADLKKEIRFQVQHNKRQKKMKNEMLRLQKKLQKLQAASPYRP